MDSPAKPDPPNDRSSASTVTSGDAIVADFKARWQRGERPRLEETLRGQTGSLRLGLIEALVRAELEMRIAAGEPARLEEYVARLPRDWTRDEIPSRLVLDEFHLRRQRGEDVRPDEYARRFPRQCEALGMERPTGNPLRAPAPNAEPDQVGPQRVFAGAAAHGKERPPHDPKGYAFHPHDIVGDYEIVRLLGEGGLARVYLARQRSLDRFVALKVSADLGHEPRTMARLDHEHIVPVYGQETIGGVRVLVMRYVPGITWQRLIERLGGADRAGDCGATLLRWLDDEAAAASPPPEGPRRAALAGSSLVATACRLVAEVARALDYAHQQGVLHRDIKPANLLLASDGRAMLMDFNVASSAAEALGDVAVLGGTAAYMAPEHLAAFDPLRPAQPAAIDRRADIYSLGVVFYELLTGRHPFRLLEASPPRGIERMTAERWRGAPPLSAAGLSTSAGLESIVGQCLAADPNRRYATAGALAEDLGRWLAHEPLRFAPERSRAERWAKWARRHARALAASAGAAAVLTAIVIGTAAMIHVRLGRARSCLDRASATLAERKAVAAAAELLAAEQYLSGPDWLFLGAGADDSRDRLRARFRQLARDAAGQQGRDFRAAASTLRLWDVANRPRVDDVLNIFAVLERPDWQRLPTWKHATRFGPSPLEDDVAEFLALKAWARIREAATAASSSPVQDEVRLLLSRVPLRHQSSVVLRKLLELSASAEPLPLSLDDDERARCREFDWYLVGMLHAAGGQFEPASQEFGQALASSSPVPRPRFWAVFMRSYCLAQLGKTQLAIDGYRQCLDLQPLAPWTHFNLGLLYHGQGEAERAIEHFEIALAQDPKMGAAHNNIGVARCAQGRYREAVESFHRAIETGYRAVDVYLNRGSARAALQQRDRAREDFQTALQLDPHCERAREKLRLLDQLP